MLWKILPFVVGDELIKNYTTVLEKVETKTGKQRMAKDKRRKKKAEKNGKTEKDRRGEKSVTADKKKEIFDQNLLLHQQKYIVYIWAEMDHTIKCSYLVLS